MYLLFDNSNPNKSKLALVNLEMADALVYNDQRLTTSSVPTQAMYYKSNEEGIERFQDVIAALLSGKVEYYELTQPVGHWKKEEKAAGSSEEEPHKTTRRKAAPKKEAS